MKTLPSRLASELLIDRYGANGAQLVYEQIFDAVEFTNDMLHPHTSLRDVLLRVAVTPSQQARQSNSAVTGAIRLSDEVVLTLGGAPLDETLPEIRPTVLHEKVHLEHEHHLDLISGVSSGNERMDDIVAEGIALFGETTYHGPFPYGPEITDVDAWELIYDIRDGDPVLDWPVEPQTGTAGFFLGDLGYRAGQLLIEKYAEDTGANLTGLMKTPFIDYAVYAAQL